MSMRPRAAKPIISRREAVRRACLLWVAADVAGPLRRAHAAADAAPRVEARRDGDAIVLSARVPLHASRQQAWEVLTDYERYPAFVPDLKRCRVVERNGATVLLDQEGEAGFVLFHYPIRMRLEVTEQPTSRVDARALQGNFRQMDGTYELLDEGGVLVFAYRGRLVPDFVLPPLVGMAAVRNATERQLGGLIAEIHRRAALEAGKP